MICEYIGGGFGSKFAADYWTVAAARIAKRTGRPVKFMLDRDQDQMIAGNRPSGYIRVRLGADEDGAGHGLGFASLGHVGTGTRWSQHRHDSVRLARRRTAAALLTPIDTNLAPARAWRAPSNPQACLLTQSAFDDLAAKMGVDSYDVFWKNLDNISSGQTAEVYREQMEIGAKLMDWKAKWHPHGKGPAKGSIVEGLGMAIHTWRTGGHASTCRIRIHPDGAVQSYCGTQDLGTGTRTVCAMVVAETFGLKLDDVQAEHRHVNLSRQRAVGWQHDGRWRVGIASSRSAGCPCQAVRTGRAETGDEAGCTRGGQRPHSGDRQAGSEPQLGRGLFAAGTQAAGSHGRISAGAPRIRSRATAWGAFKWPTWRSIARPA